jgi:hypothetical protein
MGGQGVDHCYIDTLILLFFNLSRSWYCAAAAVLQKN